MNLFAWMTGHLSDRGKALSLCKRAAASAKKHNHQGAIDDYTATIDMPDTPADVKATALYNRALEHVATGDERKVIADLSAVLAMGKSLTKVKARARQKIAQIQSRCRQSSV